MKKYIKPATILIEMDDCALMAESQPGISQKPSEGDACAKSDYDVDLWHDADDIDDDGVDDRWDRW